MASFHQVSNEHYDRDYFSYDLSLQDKGNSYKNSFCAHKLMLSLHVLQSVVFFRECTMCLQCLLNKGYGG